MRYFAIATIFVCACAATRNEELPKGRSSAVTHDDFASIRPTVIAVMPVDAPSYKVAHGLRKAIYNRLFPKSYSPMKLNVVDKKSRDGSIDRKSLGWDAVFRVKVTKWKKYRGGQYIAATGEAEMVHLHGEVLWKATFTDYPLEAEVTASNVDITRTIEELADVITRKVPTHSTDPAPSR